MFFVILHAFLLASLAQVNFGQLPKLPSIPDLPKLPSIPDIPKLPSIPDLPKLPSIPDLPKLPELPNLPSLPELPTIPDLPVMSALPDLPLKHGLDPNEELSPYVINGQRAVLGQFPYQALLIMSNSDGRGSICGGSLISRNFVLTAAHCVQIATSVRVSLGTLKSRNMPTGSTAFTILNSSGGIIRNTNYNPRTFENDIALIRLPSAVTLSSFIQPIRLVGTSQRNQNYWDQKRAVISGWGSTETQGKLASEDLMYATVNIWRYSDCMNTIFSNSRHYPVSGICTDTAVSATCEGDSGGPLVVWENDGVRTLVGVTSYYVHRGDEVCRTAKVNVFAFTGYQLSWIQYYTGIQPRA